MLFIDVAFLIFPSMILKNDATLLNFGPNMVILVRGFPYGYRVPLVPKKAVGSRAGWQTEEYNR